MFAVKRILVPVDYSDTSRAALSVALQMADRSGAELTVLHVQPYLERELKEDIASSPDATNDIAAGIDAEQLRLQETVDLEYQRAEEAGQALKRVSTRLLVAGGDPLENVMQRVEDDEIDLVVTGTHGPRGLKEHLLGSISERLVAKAPCSVFVVKPAGYPYLRD